MMRFRNGVSEYRSIGVRTGLLPHSVTPSLRYSVTASEPVTPSPRHCLPPSLRYHRTRGTILIVTLWIIVILTGLVITFAQTMRVDVTAASNHIAAVQAAQVELGAEKYVLSIAEQLGTEALYVPEQDFQAIPIGLDPTDNTKATGYFWIVRPNFFENDLPAFGLVDEASKINLNTATSQQIASLPSVWMTDELAAAMVDWRDKTGNVSPLGAGSDYYSTLSPPYTAKNDDYETVEELLLVRDVYPQVLYGQDWMPTSPMASDANAGMFGGTRQPASGAGGPGTPSTGGFQGLGGATGGANSAMFNDWSQLHGIYDYFTVYSNEPGASGSNTSGTASAARSTAQPAAAGASGQRTATVTTTQTKPTRGLINVLTAPRDVLITLGLDDNDVNAIIQARSDSTLDRSSSSAWLSKVLPQKAASIENYVTVNSYQYSAEIVAVSRDGRAFKRVRIVVDTRSTPAIIVYRADLTERGWPWQLPREYLDELRSGTFVSSPIVTSNGPASTGALGSGGTGGGR